MQSKSEHNSFSNLSGVCGVFELTAESLRLWVMLFLSNAHPTSGASTEATALWGISLGTCWGLIWCWKNRFHARCGCRSSNGWRDAATNSMMCWVAGQTRWCWRECRPPIGDRALLALQCNWLRVESSSCFFYASRFQRRFRNAFFVTKTMSYPYSRPQNRRHQILGHAAHHPFKQIPLQNEAHLNYGRNLTYIISAASHFIGLCADHVRIGYDSIIMIIWCPHFVFAWTQLWDVEIIAGRYQKLQVLVLQCQKPPHEVSLKMECETDMCPGRTLQTFGSMIWFCCLRPAADCSCGGETTIGIKRALPSYHQN